MPIEFKAIEKGQPGVFGGGRRKFYASPVQGKDVTLELLARGVEKNCTVNGADVRAVLYALVEEAIGQLSEGRIVRLGNLGSLRVALKSEGRDAVDKLTEDAIKEVGVSFTPGSKLKAKLDGAKYKRV